MKKFRLFAFFSILLVLIGCASTGKQTGSRFLSDIFVNEENGTLTIANHTNVDLVIFAGNVARGNVLGGIKAYSSRSFNIAKIPDLPGSGAFIVNAVLFETYLKKQLVNSDDVLYSNLFHFDDITNDKRFMEIPDVIDESMTTVISFSNDTSIVARLRLYSPYGPVITVLAPYEQNKKVWLKPDSRGFIAFPDYIFFDDKNQINNIIFNSDELIFLVTPNQANSNIMNFILSNYLITDEKITLLFN